MSGFDPIRFAEELEREVAHIDGSSANFVAPIAAHTLRRVAAAVKRAAKQEQNP